MFGIPNEVEASMELDASWMFEALSLDKTEFCDSTDEIFLSKVD